MKKSKINHLLVAAVTTVGLLVSGCASSGAGSSSDTSPAENSVDSPTTAVEESEDTSNEAPAAEVRTITVATSANPRPYTYQDESGNLTGYNIELTEELFKLLPQYELQLEVTEFDSCLTGLSAGRYQIVANNLGYRDERAELYVYEGPLNRADNAIAYKSGRTVNSLEDIKEWITEGEPQIAETNYLIAYFESHDGFNTDNIQFTEKQPAQQYQDLEDGTVDFLLTSTVSFNSYVEEFGYTDLEYYVLNDQEVTDLKDGLKLGDVYYCLNTDETQLAQDLVEAMKQYKQSGDWDKLATKWFGTADLVPSLDAIGYWDYTKK